jgi:hypothetical protein
MTKWQKDAAELERLHYQVLKYTYEPQSQKFVGYIVQRAPNSFNDLVAHGFKVTTRIANQEARCVLISWEIDLTDAPAPATKKPTLHLPLAPKETKKERDKRLATMIKKEKDKDKPLESMFGKLKDKDKPIAEIVGNAIIK